MDQTQSSVSSKPKIISTRELIKGSLSDYRQNWKKFAWLLIIPLILSYLGSLGSYLSGAGLSAKINLPPWLAVFAIIVIAVLVVAFVIVYILAYAAEFLLVKDLSQEVKWKNLADWYKRGWPYFWVIVGVSLIYGILGFIGFILLIIPGIIFCVYYCFTLYAVLFEDHKFEGSFGRSRELVSGYWWPVFGRFLIGIILVYIVYVIIGGLFAGLIWLIAVGLNFPYRDLFDILYNLLSVFVGLVIGPLTLLYTYKIYRSLREVKNI